MKSIVILPAAVPRVYPWLGILGNNVVIFTGPRRGIAIAPTIGIESAGWAEENFKHFSGTVELSND